MTKAKTRPASAHLMRPIRFDQATLRRLFRTFIGLEGSSILAGLFWGIVAAGLLHLLMYDKSFQRFISDSYSPLRARFDDPKAYVPYALIALIALLGFALIRTQSLVRRGLRSWVSGVTSGLRLVPFACTAAIFVAPSIALWLRILLDSIAIVVAGAIAFVFYAFAAFARHRTPKEKDVGVPPESKSITGTGPMESDDPIENWSEDMIGRANIVESLAIKLLISRAPVIGLFGALGSGKSSILNLLRHHLSDKAIVVSFSTWLPGSQETLTTYLMADIASECQKRYVVPGLQRGTRRFANALGVSVPMLKGLRELLPVATQRDDIEGLRNALLRLPERVIVLLDELDRMQQDELTTLLKVVRGISSLPNLSFVCAADQETLIKTIKRDTDSSSSGIYFEKFFPFIVPVPPLDDDDLRRVGVERVLGALRQRRFFSDGEEQDFRKELDKLWERRIAPFCGTLRAIGLLSNDVGVAAAPLRREVNAVDLVLIELLRRSRPKVYDLVSRNGVALTGGEGILRGGTYYSDEETKRILERFRAELAKILEGDLQANQVKALLGELFPDFTKAEGLSWSERPQRKLGDREDKSLSAPSMFPAYFRYELPKALFSAAELEEFIAESRQADSEQSRRDLFRNKLDSLEKGSLRKDDFLRKLADSVRTVDLPIARSWIFTLLTLANELTYDMFAPFAEAGHFIRMIIRYAERLKDHADRVRFLSECIVDSNDDTMPVRILTLLTSPKSDGYQQVSFAELYPSFISRMRSRYGYGVEANGVDLRASDSQAFSIWGNENLAEHNLHFDAEDRRIQHDFWRRYIGNSRSRLVVTFNEHLMPYKFHYPSNPEPFIATKMDIETLRKLFAELPDDPGMQDVPPKYVRRLQRFLDGDFNDGVPMHDSDNDSSENFAR